jgi:hypothetical protein
VAGRASAPGPPTVATLTGYRSLVEAGADVTARDERFGATALEWAGWTKQDAVLAYLKSVMKEADQGGDAWHARHGRSQVAVDLERNRFRLNRDFALSICPAAWRATIMSALDALRTTFAPLDVFRV